MPSIDVRSLGDFIREQRAHSQISLRELAKQAGVSNPYLSQIERGLRRPSAEILQQIAKGLRISAEVLYVQAGFLEERPGGGAVPDAIRADPAITERQKQVLLEIYESFFKESAARGTTTPAPPAPAPQHSRAEAAPTVPVHLPEAVPSVPASSTSAPSVPAPSVAGHVIAVTATQALRNPVRTAAQAATHASKAAPTAANAAKRVAKKATETVKAAAPRPA